MHKIGKDIGMDEEKLKIIEKRKEEEDFQKFISEKVNSAEKMVRDYEMAMRKAYRKGIIPEKTPYNEVIERYIKNYMKKSMQEDGRIKQICIEIKLKFIKISWKNIKI